MKWSLRRVLSLPVVGLYNAVIWIMENIGWIFFAVLVGCGIAAAVAIVHNSKITNSPPTTHGIAVDNARAWVRAVYGGEGRVACVGDTCDVSVPQATQPFSLVCSDEPRGSCRLYRGH